MPKPNLTLGGVFDDVEVDIGDSIYSGLTALSTTTSISSSLVSSQETRTVAANTTTFRDLPQPPSSPPLSRKSSLGHLTSPSSPSLNRVVRPRALSRSQTLSSIPSIDTKSRFRHAEIEGLEAVSSQIRRWILGIAIVDFDLDHGPVISGIYPPLFVFPDEAEHIAFASFPDSSQFEQGTQVYSFRIREHEISMPSERRPAPLDGFIYGFSHFTQRRDSKSRRGYEQKSVVFLTHRVYPSLFTELACIFGPLFQSHGIPMLEAACHNIATWSDPIPGMKLELGFLGSVLRVEIPQTDDEQQITKTPSLRDKFDSIIPILVSTPPLWPPPLMLFEACIQQLWSIWECLVLGEPILIFGSSPAQTSQAVWWFRDLVRPIPFSGDIRPYFTIHDGDHAALVNRLPPKYGLLLGVTNPFFERACAHWPHLLSLGRRVSENAPLGPPPGWKTKSHKRYISKDRVLLKQLENVIRGSEQELFDASIALRQHFCTRSSELLTPLTRYLQTLIPTYAEVEKAHQSKSRLRLKPFNSVNFFGLLKKDGSPLPFRSSSRRTEFYERWLKTPAFGMWLGKQEAIVQGVLKENVEKGLP